MIRKPYLLFLGDAPDKLASKVAQGINDWRPEHVVGQLRLRGCNADLGIDEMSLEEARAAGAQTLVVGVANRGGIIAENWKEVLIEALESGYDLASGLHNHLNDEPALVAAAERYGRKMHDVRRPTVDYPIASGRKRSGKRCLAVGTDVSVGKMYASLALHKELASRGVKSTFRPTGQTGILVEGSGIPLDAVIADFMAGAVEWLTPDNEPDHWDLVEGQGSLFHASYSGVTLSLIHGSQPDAIVVCHEPNRPHMRGLPDYRLPTLVEVRDLALTMARIVNPDCRAIGVSLNTSALSEDEALACIREAEEATGLPATDPIRLGVNNIVESLLEI